MQSLRLLLLAFVGWAALAVTAAAQETVQIGTLAENEGVVQETATDVFAAASLDAPLYDEWESVATRAEAAVSASRASEAAFETLRAEIVGWREEFQSAQSSNASRLQTLRSQLEALGAAPEDGQTEAADIAERRAALNEQIARLAAPGVKAGEAFRRADGIISEIDTILRERRADALLRLGPTPLNPSLYQTAAEDIGDSLDDLREGVQQSWSLGRVQAALRESAASIAFLLVLALLGLARARFWVERLVQGLEHKRSGAGRRLVGFLISLGQVVLPLIGLFALSRALLLTDLFADYGEAIIRFIPSFGLAIFAARWIGARVFPLVQEAQSRLNLPEGAHRACRRLLLGLGVISALRGLLGVLSETDSYAEESQIALGFVLIVIAGWILWRLGRVLMQHSPHVDEEGAPQPTFIDRMLRSLSQALRLVGIIGPLTALIGYFNIADAVIYPTIATLGLLSVLAILSRVISDLYVVLSRRPDGDDGLIPTVATFVMIIASLPLFALLWGATITDLGEMWAAARAGVTVGDVSISPGSFAVLVVVFIIGYSITRFVQSALRATILPKTQMDIGGQTAIVSGVGYVGIFLAALIAISSAGLDLSSLAIVAGALSVGIGFGLQTVVSNFVSGIILLIERPISEGDWIEVGGNMGYVRDISVRSTRIETFDRSDVIVPNADLISGTVTNYTRGNSVGRVIVPVGVAYGTDTRKVEEILREIAEAHPMVLLKPPPGIVFMGFGADSMDFQIRAILRDVNWMLSVKSDMNHEIAKRFTEEDIEIPFAQRDVWLRNPEALQGQTAPEANSKGAGDDSTG